MFKTTAHSAGEQDARETVDPMPGGPSTRPARLSGVPLADLVRELRSRGFETLPAGAFAEATRELAHELAQAQAVIAAAAARQRELVDATELWHKLSEYAEVHYPAAVEEICELYRKNADLEIRAARAEDMAAKLAEFMAEDAAERFESGEGA